MGNFDERIASYLDGRMSDTDLKGFEAEMQNDAELAERVVTWQRTDALLREAYDGPIKAGVDDQLLARLGLAATPNTDVVDINSVRKKPEAANSNIPFARKWRWPAGGAIAASLLVFTIVQFQPSSDPGDSSAFANALETTPSRQVAKLDAQTEMSPILTFAAADGRYCREFTLSGQNGGQSGVACRNAKSWQIEALSKGGVKLADGTQIETAAGSETRSLDAAYTRLGASDPFNFEKEKELLSSGWEK